MQGAKFIRKEKKNEKLKQSISAYNFLLKQIRGCDYLNYEIYSLHYKNTKSKI